MTVWQKNAAACVIARALHEATLIVKLDVSEGDCDTAWRLLPRAEQDAWILRGERILWAEIVKGSIQPQAERTT